MRWILNMKRWSLEKRKPIMWSKPGGESKVDVRVGLGD